MFVRFVIGNESEDHRKLNGIIAEAAVLTELTFHERALRKEAFDWFNGNLPVPPYSWKQWSYHAAAWFKGEPSPELAEKVWDLVALLSEHGKFLRILRSTDPGIIRYEDEWQVVVEEFAEIKLIDDNDWFVKSIPASVAH